MSAFNALILLVTEPFRYKLSRTVTLLLVILGLVATGCRSRALVVYSAAEVAMGTLVEITLLAPDTTTARGWIRSAATELHRIGFDFWEGEHRGALGRLNRERWTDNRELIQLIQEAFQISRLTGGRFDIRVGELVRSYGFVNKEYPSQKPDSISRLVEAAQLLRWEPDSGGYRLSGSNATLTLGGIAKGYAVDRVVDLLQNRGCRGGIVNAGGDLRAWSNRNLDPWSIGIEDPRSDTFLALIELRNGAVATSGSYRSRYVAGEDTVHHLIDPGEGLPVRGKRSVSVTATNCTWADALATGLFVMPLQEALELADSLPGIGALILTDDGRLHQDEDMARLRSGKGARTGPRR